MCSFQDQVPVSINQRLLGLGKTAPQQEYKPIFFLRYQLDDPVRKRFPAAVLVRSCLTVTDCQACINQQDPLICPFFQVAVFRYRDAQVRIQFLENIDQRRRFGDAPGNRET